MGIEVTISESKPELDFKFVFMEEMKLKQKQQYQDDVAAYYTVQVTYRMYAVDSNGKRHFLPKVNILEIEDYGAVAYAKALQGDFDLANAAGAIELAIANILTDQRGAELGAATLV